MAGCNARQHGAGEHYVTDDLVPSQHGGQGPCGWDAQCCHGFAYDIFAKNGSESGAPVALARERRATGALELNVASRSSCTDDLAQKNCATVSELGHELPELVTCVGSRNRVCAG